MDQSQQAGQARMVDQGREPERGAEDRVRHQEKDQGAEAGDGGGVQKYNRVMIFSATMHRDRDALGEKITAFLQNDFHGEVIDTVVRQSSDAEFHCLTITLFLRDLPKRRRSNGRRR